MFDIYFHIIKMNPKIIKKKETYEFLESSFPLGASRSSKKSRRSNKIYTFHIFINSTR